MSRIYKIYCLLLVAICLSGCIRFHAQPILADKAFGDFEERSLAAAELKEFFKVNGQIPEWPIKEWDIRSLTLASLFFHPDLDVARAQWGVARAGLKSAGESPNPTASASLGFNRSTPAGEITPWIPAAALEIPVETAGKRGYRRAQARHLAEAARLHVLAVAWEVRGRLRRAFLDLFAARESGSIWSARQAIEEEAARILAARLAAGEASAYEVTQTRIALGQSRLNALDAAEQGVRAQAALAAALGVPAHALDGVALRFDELLDPAVAVPDREIRRRALLSRADILAALAEYQASQAALQVEIAKQYPDINIGPGYELDQTDVKWTLGLNLLLGLFNRNRGPIAEAEARRSEAAARFQALQAGVIAEVETAASSCRSAVDRARTAVAMLDGLNKVEAIASEQFTLGEISKLELLDVRLELAAGRLSRLDELVKAQSAITDLEAAMQAPLGWETRVLESPTRGAGQAQEQKK